MRDRIDRGKNLCILPIMPKPISERLKQARTKLGVNQIEFAKYFNVNQSTVSRWETNDIKIDHRTLFWIEHVLGTLGFVYANKQRASQ